MQTKLTIGRPGDRYEREADSVADRVTTGQPASAISAVTAAGLGGGVQRMGSGEEEEAVQGQGETTKDTKGTKEEKKEEEPAQAQMVQRQEEGDEEPVQESSQLANGSSQLVQRQENGEEEEAAQARFLQRQEAEEEETAQARLVQRQESEEEETAQTQLVQRQESEEEEESAQARLLQRQESEEEEPAQAQLVQRQESEQEEEPGQMKALQRQESEEEEPAQARVQRQEEAEEEEAAQARAVPGSSPRVPPQVEARLRFSGGQGRPLPESARRELEPRFGHDFSHVRIHTESGAADMNRALKAQAFTRGAHIYFGPGRFDLGSSQGRHLLSHELTHVVQQGKAPPARSGGGNGAAPGGGLGRNGAARPAQMQPLPDVQAQEEDDTPTEAEKAAAIAAAEAAELSASQTVSKNEQEVEKSQAEEAREKESGKAAEQEAAQADAAAEAKAGEPVPGEADAEGEAEGKGEGKGGKAKEKPAKGARKKAAQKGEAEGAAEDDKAPASPDEDPAFQAVKGKVARVSTKQQSHDPAQDKAGEAQAAAESPASELEGKAQTNQVGEMEEAETPAFNAAAFKAQLMERIAALAPKTTKEADDFKSSNRLGGLKQSVQGKVSEEKQASKGPLEEKSSAVPDPSGIEPKPVTPVPPAQPGAAPGGVSAQKAAPKPKGKSEVEQPLQEDAKRPDQEMEEAGVTEEQLAKSNEPQFLSALEGKKQAKANARQATQEYRQAEQERIGEAKGQAVASAEESTQGMFADRAALLTEVEGQQGQAKSNDEQARDKVGKDIKAIYEKTKAKVEGILNDLDGKVEKAFDAGAEAAKQSFENYVASRMRAYKQRRYGGWFGWAKWAKDKLLGMPSEVNVIYVDGRNLFLKKMDAVIDNVVEIIGTALTEAKAEIAKGKQEIQDYVNQLPEDLKKVGQDAAADIQDRFDQLESSVDNKQNQLIDSLANKYNQHLKAVDSRIEEMKAANRGLVDKVVDAVKGVIQAIRKLKNMLTNMLSRIAGVIGKIIADPIGFLGNLVKGLKQGFNNFVERIGTHLKKGLIVWLTGSLGPMGITIPDNVFSLKGIFSLVMQVLGLSWDYIRAKAVKLLGEPAVKLLEGTFKVFQILITQGPAGLWEFVKEKFGDLKEMVMGQIKEMLITEIIKAGVKWVLGLLNPVGAFIKAAMAIYEIVKFLVDKASQIADFINAVIDAVAAVANGAIGAAAKLVENALAKAVPLIIGLLASILGISGVAKRAQGIIKSVRKRIDRAIDKLILKAKKLLRKGGKAVREGAKKVVSFVFPSLSFQAEKGKTHVMKAAPKGAKPGLIIESSPGRPVAPYLYRLKPKIAQITVKKKKTRAENAYAAALKLRPKADKALENVLIPKTSGTTTAEKNVQKYSRQLLNKIKIIWTNLGVSRKLLPGEAEVGTYGQLRGKPKMTPHHIPQNGIMKRLGAWVRAYWKRAEVDGFRENAEERLAGLGVKYSKISSYKDSRGISFQMERMKHGKTRTYGKLPQDLLVKPGEYEGPKETVKGRPIGDEKLVKFVHIVKDEFQKDRLDVENIYEGKKELPEVPPSEVAKVKTGVSKSADMNASEWGSFLR